VNLHSALCLASCLLVCQSAHADDDSDSLEGMICGTAPKLDYSNPPQPYLDANGKKGNDGYLIGSDGFVTPEPKRWALPSDDVNPAAPAGVEPSKLPYLQFFERYPKTGRVLVQISRLHSSRPETRKPLACGLLTRGGVVRLPSLAGRDEDEYGWQVTILMDKDAYTVLKGVPPPRAGVENCVADLLAARLDCQKRAKVTLTNKLNGEGWTLFGTFDLPNPRRPILYLPAQKVTLGPQQLESGPVVAWYRDVTKGQRPNFFFTAIDAKPDSTAINAVAQLIATVVAKSSSRVFITQDSGATTETDCTKENPIKVSLLDLGLVPTATQEAAAAGSWADPNQGFLKSGRTITVYACPPINKGSNANDSAPSGPGTPVTANADCTLSSAKTAVSQRQAQARASSPRVALFGDFTFDSNLSGSSAGTAEFESYQYVPTQQIGSTQQLFQLQPITKPLARFSASLLLSLIWPRADCTSQSSCNVFGVGAGPSVVNVEGTGTLRQWTGNLLWQPPCMNDSGMYFSAGLGFRYVEVPLNGINGIVAVPIGVSGTTAPNAPTTRSTPVWVASLGLALDLSLVTDAATSIFGVKSSAGASKGSGN
jgi:hypothetical protein